MNITETYVVDKKGNPVAVQLPIREYNRLLEDVEELEDIKAYRKSKTRKRNIIPVEVAFKEITTALKSK